MPNRRMPLTSACNETMPPFIRQPDPNGKRHERTPNSLSDAQWSAALNRLGPPRPRLSTEVRAGEPVAIQNELGINLFSFNRAPSAQQVASSTNAWQNKTFSVPPTPVPARPIARRQEVRLPRHTGTGQGPAHTFWENVRMVHCRYAAGWRSGSQFAAAAQRYRAMPGSMRVSSARGSCSCEQSLGKPGSCRPAPVSPGNQCACMPATNWFQE